MKGLHKNDSAQSGEPIGVVSVLISSNFLFLVNLQGRKQNAKREQFSSQDLCCKLTELPFSIITFVFFISVADFFPAIFPFALHTTTYHCWWLPSSGFAFLFLLGLTEHRANFLVMIALCHLVCSI